jgi:hypothetical protein
VNPTKRRNIPAINTGARRAVIEALYRDGAIHDSGGRTTEILLQAMQNNTVFVNDKVNLTNLISVLRSMDNDKLIKRVVRGKRTFRIELAEPLPHSYDGVLEELDRQLLIEQPEPTEQEVIEVLPPEPEPANPQEIAMHLLNLLVERVTAEYTIPADIDELKKINSDYAAKTVETLQQNEKLRLKIRELEDLVKSCNEINAGLRKHIHELNTQLDKAIQSTVQQQKALVNDTTRRVLEDLMQAPRHTIDPVYEKKKD